MYYPPGPRERTEYATNVTRTNVSTSKNVGYPVVTTTSTWQSQTGEEKYISDVVVPGALAILERGGIINNPVHITKTIRENPKGSYHGSHTNGSYFSHSDLNIESVFLSASAVQNRSSIVFDSEEVARHVRLAKQQAIAAIDPTEFAFGEDMFEIKKTIEQLRDPLGVLRSSHDKLVKGLNKLTRNKNWRSSVHGALEVSEGATALWLGSRYAYGSALYSMSDIYSKNKYFDKINRVAKPVVGKRHRAKGKSETSSNVNDVLPCTRGSTQTYNVAREGSRSLSVRTGILYRLGPRKRYNSVGQDWGLRLKDLPRAAWAVQPLTWYTDKFYNIGASITGAMNLLDPRVTVDAGWLVLETDYVENLYISDFHDSNPGWSTFAAGSLYAKSYDYSRNPWTPVFSDLKPAFNLQPLRDTYNMVDTVALGLSKLNKLINFVHRF